jgi:hypothetical protein
MNKIIKRQQGSVQLSKETFTESQLEIYEKVFSVIDRNPKLVWERDDPDHNQDFCLIGTSIEPTRNFALKVVNFARFGIGVQDTSVTHSGGEAFVVVTVRVWDKENPDIYTEADGACSTEETKRRKSKRAFHDAVGTAETRALKRAIELKFGVAIFNILIMEMFGGYDIKTGKKEQENIPQENRTTGATINKRLISLKEDGLLSEEDYNDWKERIVANKWSLEALKRIQREVKDLEVVKRGSKSN